MKCKCGCGQEVKPGNVWIHTHHLKGRKFSKETRRKISQSHKGMKPSMETRRKISKGGFGRKHTEEACRKISEANTGLKRTKEFCRKMSMIATGRKFSDETKSKMSEKAKRNKNSFGFKHTEETLRKMSIAHKGKNKGNKWNLGFKHTDKSRKNMSMSHGGDGDLDRLTYHERVKIAQEWKCNVCGMTKDESMAKFKEELSIHHSDKNRKNNNLENLVILCKAHHTQLHSQLRINGGKR